MATYEIHGREASDDKEAALLALRATKAGFSLAAFVFGPFWLAVRRLWIPFAVYVVAAAVVFALAVSGPLGPVAVIALGLTAALFIGFEGPGWRSRALARRGAPVLDVIEAGGAEEAIERFVARGERPRDAAPAREARPAPRPRDTQVLGLFPEARKP